MTKPLQRQVFWVNVLISSSSSALHEPPVLTALAAISYIKSPICLFEK